MTIARPASDLAAGAFAPSTGVTLFGCIDEVSPSDADYISAGNTTVGAVGLSNSSNPGSLSGQQLSFRAKSADGSTVVARLKQGSNLIAPFTVSNVPSAYTTFSYTLSNAEASKITDYTALSLEFETLQAPSAAILQNNGVDFITLDDGSYLLQG